MANITPSDVEPGPTDDQTVEFYETEEGVVLYDADNPLGWIQARTTLQLDAMR
jgi:hypothetical protein